MLSWQQKMRALTGYLAQGEQEAVLPLHMKIQSSYWVDLHLTSWVLLYRPALHTLSPYDLSQVLGSCRRLLPWALVISP